MNLKRSTVEMKKLQTMIKYGIRPELIPIVDLKQIDGVMAGKLYNAGIKKPQDLRRAKSLVVARIIGKKTAHKVLLDLG